ncbi:hypothetical protein JI739_19505 [Ramlibacter sp. AW1]|uniref:Circularly permuted type 2 ATP-grasp protein n=1 Tax=Ramlibacter aurantiacus TaxID=2801330 RepID=A0A937D6Q4_9BURK|nr:hypothetical protein [Ramlibacter aurantiacus]MBL0422542.1 hypothetical protein [Ramlibacter aurantiacus]
MPESVSEPSGSLAPKAFGGGSGACFCTTLDEQQLGAAAVEVLGDTQLAQAVRSRWSSAFASWPVFVSLADWRRMSRAVEAVEQVVALPGWKEEALRHAPSIARHPPQGAAGAFFGFDFHVDQESVGLIEINTNAGGALVNTLLARAQRSCCAFIQRLHPGGAEANAFETAMVEMFRTEWRLSKGQQPLRTIAIIDESPESQYLYPEFLLLQRLLERHQIRAMIADPGQLSFESGTLRCDGTAVDLVYNRLTDFYLEDPKCAALRAAYLEDGVVVTPHPQAHALYADKRRLATLCNDTTLEQLGVPAHTRALLREAVPWTTVVTAQNADELWSQRRDLFFKPFSGFGSRGAYRGDKVTKRVWAEIATGGYVAQRAIAPGTRLVSAAVGHAPLKFDLRLYAYRGVVQWTAARLYQGQTTNFRTSGGGFAPVYTLPPGESGLHCGSSLRQGHASFVFLVDDAGQIHPLPHELYVALARGEALSPTLAGQRFRIADWYVRVDGQTPHEIVSEWYGWVQFDASGKFDATGTRPRDAARDIMPGNVDTSALPTREERSAMCQSVFGPPRGVGHARIES